MVLHFTQFVVETHNNFNLIVKILLILFNLSKLFMFILKTCDNFQCHC